MARRPGLTEDSFLAHIFRPSKNAQPTGLRHTTLKPTKGRRASRVASFNRMSAVKQEILKRAGLRESYLRGEATLVQAKRDLRHSAVEKRIVKPLKPKGTVGNVENLKRRIAAHVWQTTQHVTDRYGNRKANPRQIAENIDTWLDQPDEVQTVWTYEQISSAAKGEEVNGRTYDRWIGGKQYNPFFYH